MRDAFTSGGKSQSAGPGRIFALLQDRVYTISGFTAGAPEGSYCEDVVFQLGQDVGCGAATGRIVRRNAERSYRQASFNP